MSARRRTATVVVGLVGCAVAGGMVGGCGGGEGDASGPPPIAYGMEECSNCRMIISDRRHAAAAAWHGGEMTKFDDIGCLLVTLEQREDEPRRIWVHDADSGDWLDALAASFAIDRPASTPMGSGIVALGTEEAVRSRVGPSSTIYDWEGLVASGIALPKPGEENRG